MWTVLDCMHAHARVLWVLLLWHEHERLRAETDLLTTTGTHFDFRCQPIGGEEFLDLKLFYMFFTVPLWCSYEGLWGQYMTPRLLCVLNVSRDS